MTRSQEALKKQKLSTKTPPKKALKSQRPSAAKSRRRSKEILTDEVDETLDVVAIEKESSSATKEIVTDEAIDVVALEKQKSSAAKPCPEFVNVIRAKRTVTDAAVGERLNAAALEKQKLLTVKPRISFVSGRRAKEIVTDAVVERLNGRRAEEIATDVVDERISATALETQRLSLKEPRAAFVEGPRENVIVNDVVAEGLNVDDLEKLRSLSTKLCSAFVNGSSTKQPVSDVVAEGLNVDDLEKLRSLSTRLYSAFANGSSTKQVMTDAAGEGLNAAALEKHRSPTTTPCSAFVNGSRAKDIVTGPVEQRLNAVDGMLDSGSDEDMETLDTWRDIRDEEGDMLDADGNGDTQIAEDHPSTGSDKDADIHDADGNSETQISEEQLLLTNREEVASLSKKRKRDQVQMQVTVPHTDFNNPNGTYNSQASLFRPLGTRKVIKFDKYGRACDVGSEQFATDIGKIVRANCRPAITDWRVVPNSTKEVIWKNIIAKYVVPEIYKSHILSRARVAWKNWKSHLRIEMDKYQTIAEKKENMPKRFITNREDWESFVDFCDTDEDRKLRAIGKKSRESTEFIHSTGRKGIYRIIYDLEKENPTGEVNRSAIFVDTHVSKTINDPESSSISDIKMRLIKELVEANPDRQNDIDNDAVALVCGRDGSGEVRGMGAGVTRTMLRSSATVVETLRQVQQENKSLKSDIQLLVTQSAKPNQNHTSTSSNQSASQAPPDVSNLSARSLLVPPNMSDLPAHSHFAPSAISSPASSRVAPPASDLPARSPLAPPDKSGWRARTDWRARSQFAPPAISSPASSRLAPPASDLPARSPLAPPDKFDLRACSHLAPPAYSSPASSRLAPPASDLPARSRLAPLTPNLPVVSHLAPLASNLSTGSCFVKNFKGRTIALGSFNTAEPPMEHVYSLIIDDIFDRDAELFDKDGKLGDVMIGGLINWPKACVVSNLPADSCFIRNFKRRTIAFGTFSASADPQMEHVYSVVVREIYDRSAELFDTDGKLGDVMIGGVINWPKACIKPCQ